MDGWMDDDGMGKGVRCLSSIQLSRTGDIQNSGQGLEFDP